MRGMINYMSKFVPNLSELRGPMRKLLVKDVHFSWDQQQQDAFDNGQVSHKAITKSGLVIL